MAAPYWIDSSNQIWWMRYAGGIAETVGFIMIFLILFTLIPVLTFVPTYVYGKKHGGNLKVYGLAFEDKKTALSYIGKSVLYALILIIVLFAGLSITETILNVEMATPISCIRTFRLDRLAYIVEY